MTYQNIPTTFRNENEKIEFVRFTERLFDLQMENLFREIMDRPDLRLMSLCGPTCSGKTTTSAKLTKMLESAGRPVKLISIDDFFKDRQAIDRSASEFTAKVDYDSAEAMDFVTIADCVDDLIHNRTANLPVYDFHSGKRTHTEPYTPQGNELFIFEGIQALYPEFTTLLGDVPCLSVFVNVENGYRAGEYTFDAREVRLCRRIVRDIFYRSAPAAFSLFLWAGVAANEDKNIFPNTDKADIHINSAHPYELSVLKEQLLEALNAIPEDNEYFETGRALAKKFESIQPINKEYLPQDSLYREFLRF